MRKGLPDKEYYRQWYLGRAHIYKEKHIKKTYGLSLDDLFSLIEAQGYKCAVCNTDLKDRNPKNVHIDHCHNSEDMKIRGILCNNCNMALGLLKDDVEVLKSAIKYLKKHA